MKVSRVCPKCNSREIRIVHGRKRSLESRIPAGHTVFSSVCVDLYVCCHCGFVEHWIDPNDSEKLKKNGYKLIDDDGTDSLL